MAIAFFAGPVAVSNALSKCDVQFNGSSGCGGDDGDIAPPPTKVVLLNDDCGGALATLCVKLTRTNKTNINVDLDDNGMMTLGAWSPVPSRRLLPDEFLLPFVCVISSLFYRTRTAIIIKD